HQNEKEGLTGGTPATTEAHARTWLDVSGQPRRADASTLASSIADRELQLPRRLRIEALLARVAETVEADRVLARRDDEVGLVAFTPVADHGPTRSQQLLALAGRQVEPFVPRHRERVARREGDLHVAAR